MPLPALSTELFLAGSLGFQGGQAGKLLPTQTPGLTCTVPTAMTTGRQRLSGDPGSEQTLLVSGHMQGGPQRHSLGRQETPMADTAHPRSSC